jgi:hypothetical protein
MIGIEATVTLGPDGLGQGRELVTGMCPNWALHGPASRSVEGGRVTIVSDRSIAPNGSGRVEITPVEPDAWRHLRVGDEIELRVGSRAFGVGRVVRIGEEETPHGGLRAAVD